MKDAAQNKTRPSTVKKSARSRKSTTKPNQREQIIYTASKLFHERGYNKTSITEIARQIGLDQSSIYYWFPSKEAILASIFDTNKIVPVLDQIDQDVNDRVVQLYMLIVYDVVRKCELPFDFIELEALANERPEKYGVLLNTYREYYQAVERVIEAGIEEKAFKECLVDEQVVLILSIGEGLQHHYHAKQRDKLILTLCDYEVKEHSPHEIGHMAARAILPGMLETARDIEDIRQIATEAFQKLDLSQRS